MNTGRFSVQPAERSLPPPSASCGVLSAKKLWLIVKELSNGTKMNNENLRL